MAFLSTPMRSLPPSAPAGSSEVICEEKHMGSRAVVVVCREPSVGAQRFGIESDSGGSIFTRTGRPFFSDEALEARLLDKVRAGID